MTQNSTPNFFQITRHIFITNAPSNDDKIKLFLKDKKIQHAICTSNDNFLFPNTIKTLVLSGDRLYTNKYSTFVNNVIHFYNECKSTNGNILIFGENTLIRSCIIAILIIMLKGKVNFQAAVQLLKEKIEYNENNDNILNLDELLSFENYLIQAQKFYQSYSYIRCKSCRLELCKENDFEEHTNKNNHLLPYKRLKKDNKLNRKPDECSSFYVKKLEWMLNFQDQEGTIHCPKCNSKLGSYKWSGSQCSCGAWVTPSLQILKSKVDFMEGDIID